MSPSREGPNIEGRRQHWSLFEWCVAICIGLAVFALVLGSKQTTPVHATFPNEALELLASYAFGCLALAFLLGLVSVALGYFHEPSGHFGVVAAGVLFAGGICLFCVQMITDGLNVHFDSSVAIRVTTPILSIVPAPSGSRQAATLRLIDWRDKGKVVPLRHDVLIVHTDMDKKYATFHVRQGFFGMAYASEYK